MPKFYFHSEDGSRFEDKTGTDLPDVGSALREGVKVLAELIDNDPSLLLTTEAFRVIIQDQAGLTLYVIEVTGQASPALNAAPSGG